MPANYRSPSVPAAATGRGAAEKAPGKEATMSNGAQARCSTCRFFDGSESWCRRYAPAPVRYVTRENRLDYKKVDREWPTVDVADWCGEYQKDT